jgi:hypothetical protein
MKVSDMTGDALDWAVAKCEVGAEFIGDIDDPHFYSTDWAQGGPIIEREVIVLTHPKHDCWTASAQDSTDLDTPLYQEDGTTPLIAAMRCYVASKLGDVVDVPDALM